MKYYPQHRSADYILRMAGFLRETAVYHGWAKDTGKAKPSRPYDALHAIPNGIYINLHRDLGASPREHTTLQRDTLVVNTLAWFTLFDVPRKVPVTSESTETLWDADLPI